MHRFKCLIFHDYNCSFTNVNDVFELLHRYLNVVICNDFYGSSLLLLIVTNEPNISYFFFLVKNNPFCITYVLMLWHIVYYFFFLCKLYALVVNIIIANRIKRIGIGNN